jgi:alkyl hydroperoxide reductase subunit AhpF
MTEKLSNISQTKNNFNNDILNSFQEIKNLINEIKKIENFISFKKEQKEDKINSFSIESEIENEESFVYLENFNSLSLIELNALKIKNKKYIIELLEEVFQKVNQNFC